PRGAPLQTSTPAYAPGRRRTWSARACRTAAPAARRCASRDFPTPPGRRRPRPRTPRRGGRRSWWVPAPLPRSRTRAGSPPPRGRRAAPRRWRTSRASRRLLLADELRQSAEHLFARSQVSVPPAPKACMAAAHVVVGRYARRRAELAAEADRGDLVHGERLGREV